MPKQYPEWTQDNNALKSPPWGAAFGLRIPEQHHAALTDARLAPTVIRAMLAQMRTRRRPGVRQDTRHADWGKHQQRRQATQQR